MSNQRLLLKRFLRFHRKFSLYPSWTKEKYKEYSQFQKYLEGFKKVEISSNRDSRTTKVHLTNGFTILKVPSNQLGKMKEFRNNWVLMYCCWRYRFTHQLWVFPLDKGINKITSKSIKEMF